MEDDIYELTPTQDIKDRAQQRRIIWLFTLAFICVNGFIIFGSAISPEMAANTVLIEDTIFWFNMSIMGIVGTFFGIDIATNLMNTRTSTLRKVSK